MKNITYLLFLWSFATHAGTLKDSSKAVYFDSITYSTVCGNPLVMDVYRPIDGIAILHPLVIMAHGGSFMHGNRRADRMKQLCTVLAQHGYVAVSIEYRLTNYFGMGTRRAAYRNILKAVADGRNCIQWWLRHARQGNNWHIDTTSIYVGGNSAGGILAEQLGFLDNANKGNRALRKAANRYLPDSTAHAAKLVHGIISLAGAVLDTAIITTQAPALLQIQDDGDRVVPYGYKRAVYGLAPVKMAGLGACRAIYTQKQLKFYEYVFNSKGHTTWVNNPQEFDIVTSQILTFLDKTGK